MGRHSDIESLSSSDFSDSDSEIVQKKQHKKVKNDKKDKKHHKKHHKKQQKKCDESCDEKSFISCNDGCCDMNCDTKVNVDLEAFPSVKCTKVCQRNAKFDVALDIKTKPRCHIVHKKTKRISDCKERCIFTVNIDCDYKCKPKILSDCHFPQATFDLEVDTKTKQICKAKKC